MTKRYIILLIYLLILCHIKAQDCEIALSVVIPEQRELPGAVQSNLENKLRLIATENGLGASSAANQFALTANVSLLNKRNLPGPPMQFSCIMNVHLYIVDARGKNIFSSTEVEVKGVGNSELRSFADAIRRIQPGNKHIQNFVSKGREKILAYYDNQYPSILQKAQSLAAMKNYDAALFETTRIPECSKGYEEAWALATDIYRKYVDQLCTESLALAKTEWMAEQNAAGAVKAGKHLSQIYPDAACYADAMRLYVEIKNKVADDWTFEMKKYDDSISLEQQRMEMIKSVGEAYGSGQQPSTTNLMWLK